MKRRSSTVQHGLNRSWYHNYTSKPVCSPHGCEYKVFTRDDELEAGGSLLQ